MAGQLKMDVRSLWWSDGPVLPSSLLKQIESNEPENTEQTQEDIGTLDESDYASSSDLETLNV